MHRTLYLLTAWRVSGDQEQAPSQQDLERIARQYAERLSGPADPAELRRVGGRHRSSSVRKRPGMLSRKRRLFQQIPMVE